MVLKPLPTLPYTSGRFESDVISDGTQTTSGTKPMTSAFESDVISDGTQTAL